MSTTSGAPLPPTPEAPAPESIWAKPAVSVCGLAIFAIGYGFAWLTKDATVQTMFAGAAIAMGQQVIGYWLGSSAGSNKKDATIAAAAFAAPAPPKQGVTP
jgi:VIT1/CCC1 family predicted Fe2+/Mn2+ transporter